MTGKVDICTVCAWRADCKKKFSVSGRDIRCSDFVKDISLSKKDEEDSKDEQTK